MVDTTDLAITKTVSNATPNVGDQITFTVLLSNQSLGTATGVQVSDLLPAGLSFVSASPSQGSYNNITGLWDVGTVNSSDSPTLSVTARVVSAAAQTNTATISAADQFDPDMADNTGSATETPQRADLSVTKTVSDATPNVGDQITFTVSLSNQGPDTATGVRVSDLLPAGLSFVSASPSQGSYNNITGLWSVGTVNSGDSPTLSVTAMVVSPAAQTNTGTISAADQFDPDMTHNTASATETPQADLSVTKTVSNATPNVGDQITFTVLLSNQSLGTATGVQVSDLLPAGLSFVSASPSQGSYNNITGLWNVGTVNSSDSPTLSVTARVVSAAAQTNTATISAADQFDPDMADNTGSATETPQRADLSVTKTVSDATPNVGDQITFTVSLSNQGPDTATGVRVSDLLPAGLSFVSASPSQGSYNNITGLWSVGTVNSGDSPTLSVTAMVVSPAAQTNTGTISAADQFDPDMAHNTASATETPLNLSVVYFVNGQDADTPTGPHVAAGSTVTFTYVVTNTDSVPLADVVVTDDKLGTITSFTGDSNGNGLLDPTETWVYTTTATALAGQQTNTGTVTTQDPDSPPGTTVTDDNPANYFGNAPAIRIVKFVNGQDADNPTGPHVAAGSTATFTYAVTNTGNVPLANVAVTDDTLGPITSFTGDSNGNGLLDLTETWTYTATATALAGQQTNTGTVTGRDADTGTTVTDDNPANYFGDAPAVQIVKFVNGQDADNPTGPHVAAGSPATFTYVVSNTGNVALANVAVSDDTLGPITSFTGDTDGNGLLDLTETWTYTTTATALAGQQTNTGTVTAQDPNIGATVIDDNPANYFGDVPAIQIVKFVDGQDADTPTGPLVAAGGTVTYTYVVTNTGNVALANVVVADDKLGPITNFIGGDSNGNGLLDLAETWNYTTTATALAGWQSNVGTVTGQDPNIGTTVTDDNPANYLGDTPAIDDEPTLAATPLDPTFTEGGAAADIFAGVTASTIEAGQTFTLMTLTVSNVTDGDSEILNIDGSSVELMNGRAVHTSGNGLSVTVSSVGTTATVTFSGASLDATQVQALIDGLSYSNTSQDPTGGDRVVTITELVDSGANGGADDNIATPGIASTVHVEPVNDEPTLTATAVDPTFTEGGPQVDLFESVALSTIEAGQRLTAMTWTVTNVASGAHEFIVFDDFEIALTDGNSVVADIDNMTIEVSLVGTTATLSFSDVSISAVALRNLINDMSYRNTSDDPGTADRVITITELVDSGSNTGQNDNTAALSVATTVHITAINDEPTLAATALDPTFTEGGVAADIFSGVTASTIEAGQTFTSMTLTVSNVTDGASEILSIDGSPIALTDGNSIVTATNGLTVTVTLAAGVATLTFSSASLDAAQLQALVDGLSYANASQDPTGTDRVVTITELVDSGANGAGDDNIAAPGIASTVHVTPVNDQPTLSATAVNPTFTEGGATVDVFTTPVIASTIEAGQAFTSMKLTVTGVTDGASEILSFDGSSIALTNGNSVVTATNGLTVNVSLTGTTASLTFNGATLDAAHLQDIIDGIAYNNTSQDPGASNRIVTITQLVDSGSNTAPNDGTAALGIASTVHMLPVNDAPAGTNNTITALEDTARVLTAADFGFSDTDGNTLLAVKVTTLPGAGTLTNNGVAVTAGQLVSIADINAGKLAFTGAPDANGAAHAAFTFQVQDNGGTLNGGIDLDQSANTLTIDVNAANDAPVATDDALSSIAEDSGTRSTSFAALTGNDSKGPADEAGQTLTVTSVSNAVGGTVAIVAGHVEFTLTANFNGVASFDYVTSDNGTTNGVADARIDTGHVTFSVTEVNDTPVATDDALSSVAEDSGIRSISFAALTGNDSKGPADEAGQALTVTSVSNAVGGTVAIVAGHVEFTPTANFNGAASFDYVTSDNGTTNGLADPRTDTGHVTFSVTEVNDAPVATDDALSSVAEDSGIRSISFAALTGNDSKGPADEAGQTLTVTSVSNAVGGTVAIVAGHVEFTPAANFNGTASFDYVTSDNGTTNGLADPRTDTGHVTFGVTEVNDAPVATDDALSSVAEDSGIRSISFAALTGNDSKGPADEAGQALTVTGVSNAVGGTVAIVAGHVEFTPTANFNGAASFDYVTSDNGTTNGVADPGTDTGHVTFNVTPVNDAPSGTSSTITAPEDTARVLTAADFGFSDATDGNTLTAVKITALPGVGTLRDNGVAVSAGQTISIADINAGHLTFQAALNANGAAYAAFNFQVQDNGGTIGSGVDLDQTPNTLTVNVTPVNDKPSAVILSNVHGPFPENTSTAVPIKVANIAVTDVDGGLNNLSLSGLDANLFKLIGNTLWLKAGAHLDYETNPFLNVTVNVNDPTVGGPIDAARALVIAVTDIAETIIGTPRADRLVGTKNGETIIGLAGNDAIYGNAGNDRIIGGVGADRLTGGPGNDVFVFNSIGDSAPGQSGFVGNGIFSWLSGQGLRDIITDFAHGQDRIDVSATDANTRVAGNQAFSWHGTGNFVQGSSGWLIERIYNPAGTANDKTVIYGDVNGDAMADFQIELTGLKHLVATDFVL